MGKVTGFLEIDRQDRKYRPAGDRVRNYEEFVIPLDDPSVKRQAARCMDCGIPYCHTGCPVNNQIPDWNDLVYNSDWEEAARNLYSTNNFPEVTGRICPAPCEEARRQRQHERTIVERRSNQCVQHPSLPLVSVPMSGGLRGHRSQPDQIRAFRHHALAGR